MTPEAAAEIRVFVRAGFEEPDDIVRIFLEEVYAPGDLAEDDVAAEVDKAVAELVSEQRSWPQVTDVDRLDQAFVALNAAGVIALHNAGNTQSDGYDDFREACAERQASQRIIGYCFYHWQDLERAVAGQGLYLAFGPRDPKAEVTEGTAIGRAVVAELGRVGLATIWEGTFNQRIFIPKIVWQKRVEWS